MVKGYGFLERSAFISVMNQKWVSAKVLYEKIQ
jgi:hypothetical protein